MPTNNGFANRLRWVVSRFSFQSPSQAKPLPDIPMNQYLLLVLGLGAIVAVADVNQEKVVHLAADRDRSQVLAQVKESNYIRFV